MPIYPNDLRVKLDINPDEFSQFENIWVGVKDFTFVENGENKKFSDVSKGKNLFKKTFI